MVGKIFGGFLALMVVIFGFGSWYTVDQGERTVVTRTGKVIAIAEPGPHFKFPIIDSTRDFSVRSSKTVYDRMSTYTFDQQPAEVTISVNWKINEAGVDDVYINYGTEENVKVRLLDPKVFEHVKNVLGRYTAVTAIQQREKLNTDIRMAIQSAVSDKAPITIESVQIENIDFSKAYEASVEQRMLAEVEVQKVKQNAEREKVTAEITVIKARAAAESNLAIAEAEAKAITVRGEAEARVIKLRTDALKDSPNLVALTAAEKWDGKLPATMVPNGALPFVGVK